MENESAYKQCLNCKHRRWKLFGKIYCKQFGKQSVKELKELHHCAGQSMKYMSK